MSELDNLQSAAHNTKSGLDGSASAAANLEKSTDQLAQQFASLGSKGTAQILSGAKGRLSTYREHIAQAQKALDEYVSDCERAKGNG